MKIHFTSICFLFVTVFCFAQAPKITRGPYLQIGTPTSMHVRFKTDSSVVASLFYGQTQGSLTLSLVDTAATVEHEFVITGLSPFTKYFYQAKLGTTALTVADSSFHFVTSPVTGSRQPIQIWAIGDFGKANQPQIDTREAYLNYAGKKHTDAWIWLGDNAYYSGTDSEYQAELFDMYPGMMRNVVTWPAPGNHDYVSVNLTTHDGPYYRNFSMPTKGEAGGVPSGQEGFYSYDYGNVHLLSLNSEYPNWYLMTDSAMVKWIAQDLDAAKASGKIKWTIAYWHKPPYTRGTHNSDVTYESMKQMRENIVPLLEEKGVDLVLCGHSHNYERSYLINGHYGLASTFDKATMMIDSSSGNPTLNESYEKNYLLNASPKGTVYGVVGCSGSLGCSGTLDHPVHYKSTCSFYGSLVLDIYGNSLKGTFLTSLGFVDDEFEIDKYDSTNVGITDIENAGVLKVYPNPVKNMLTIEFSDATKFNTSFVNSKAFVFNSVGQKVAEVSLNSATSYLNTSSFLKGNYVIQIQTEKQFLTSKFIVE